MDEVRLIDASKIENQKIHYESEQKENVELFLGGAMAVMGMIHNAPTIDPESLRPTAKWIIVRRMADGAECKCGNCGRKEVFTTFDRHTEHAYCCRCGCKMEAAFGSEVHEE